MARTVVTYNAGTWDVAGVAPTTLPTTAPVTSVFGRTGAVTAQSGDYTAAQVGALASGAAAGGALDGTYPNPGLANSVAGTGLSESSDVLSVNYGTTSTTACVGNDSRLSDSRAPTGSAGGDLGSTFPNPTVAQIAAAPSHLTLPVNTSAESTEGRVREDSTTHATTIYDTQRERVLGAVGWTAYAFPVGYANSDTVNTTVTLAANGGSIAMPIAVTANMLLQNIYLRNADTANLRQIEWVLYLEYLNNGNSGENTLTSITGADGTLSFTPSAASIRTSAASGAPVYLGPGCYWLVIRNTHASNTFALSCGPAGTLQPDLMQTKTLSSALSSTLDFVAATWTKNTNSPAVLLQGRVFGQTVAF